MDSSMKTRAIVLLFVLLFLSFGSGCGKEGGNRTTGVSPVDSMIQKEVPRQERASPSPKPETNVSLKLLPENPDALTGIRVKLESAAPGSRILEENLRWFVNGAEIGRGNVRLQGKYIQRGETVHVLATVVVNGEEIFLESAPVTVENSYPETVSAELSPLAPRTGEVVRVVAKGRDADGDPVTFRVRWFVNDKEISGESSDLFSLKTVPKGSWLHAEVQSFDGIAAGSKMLTSKVLVVNSPPVVDRVTIAQGDGSVYSASVMVTDPDGDPVTIHQKTLPEGVVLSGNILTGDVSSFPPGTEAPVVLHISDGDGGDIEYSFRLASQK
jgi:hypothetical protein